MIAELRDSVGLSIDAACTAVGVAPATWHRRHSQTPKPVDPLVGRPFRPHPAALTGGEQADLVEVLCSERFVDKAPAEIHAILLDEGTYMASVATMYRVLRQQFGDVKERRAQATHPAHAIPELCAKAVNQVWTWDVTKLRGPVKGEWFFLYWIMDVFSRYAVGWCVSAVETSDVSEQLIRDTINLYPNIVAEDLTIHADRGSAQTASNVVDLMIELEITRSHSRPRVSNDNPYSEAGFKTLKYRPGFPDRFRSRGEAEVFLTEFFGWYNGEHRHKGIAMLTPAQRHFGQAERVLGRRQRVMDAAAVRFPARFAERPVVAGPESMVWINKPVEEEGVSDPT